MIAILATSEFHYYFICNLKNVRNLNNGFKETMTIDIQQKKLISQCCLEF